MNYLESLSNESKESLEQSIIIQQELDKCNEKMKKYEIKYNTDKKEEIKKTYDYLQNLLLICDELDQKLIMDDINTLIKYIEE